MEQNEVNTAFEILLEEIEEVFNFLNEDAETAFKSKDYEKAKQLIENGEKLKQFREKIKALQTEWQNLFG
ncbi:MAG: winged helix-turn-helix domain-containing protein, partial [Candidatus Hydrogenedens sp.]